MGGFDLLLSGYSRKCRRKQETGEFVPGNTKRGKYILVFISAGGAIYFRDGEFVSAEGAIYFQIQIQIQKKSSKKP